jgi:TRAP-type C4-dicarboxylate transport system substrate-binding protein
MASYWIHAEKQENLGGNELMATRLAIGLAGVIALSAGYAVAEEYRAINYLEPTHPVSILAFDDWAKHVETETAGRVSFENFNGGALGGPQAALESIAGGVAQAGFVTALYAPSVLPISASLADFGWTSPDPYVLVAAFSDFAMNDAQANAEWTNGGVVYGMGFSTPPYYFLCKKPVGSASAFKGLRIRTPGTAYPRFVEALGAVSVNMPSTETFSAFDRGVIDCAAQDITQLVAGANLLEQIGGVTLVPMGPSFVGATHVYNKDFWSALSEEDRRNLLNADAWATAHLNVGYQREVDSAIAGAREKGVELIQPEETLNAALTAFVASGMGSLEEAKRIGAPDPESTFSRFVPYLRKWEGIIGGMKDRMDEEELTTIMRENLYDKIDVSTYGVN